MNEMNSPIAQKSSLDYDIRMPTEAEPVYSYEHFRLWHVWSDDPQTVSPPEMWKVWATDPALAVLAVRQQLRQVRDDYASIVIGITETGHAFEARS
jgi:hypothetical protein